MTENEQTITADANAPRRWRADRIAGAIAVAVIGYFTAVLIWNNIRPADPLLETWQPYSPAAFSEASASGRPFVVGIYAPWCPTCINQHRALEQIWAEGGYPEVAYLRADYDEDVAFRQALGINYTGALLVFVGNEAIGEERGLTTVDELKVFLEQVATLDDIAAG